jgi:hypothetical protein
VRKRSHPHSGGWLIAGPITQSSFSGFHYRDHRQRWCCAKAQVDTRVIASEFPGRRTSFIGAAAVAFCSFAVFGLFSSVGSLIVHDSLHESSPFIWGLAGFLVLGVSALTQTVLAKLSVPRMLIMGLCAAPVGIGSLSALYIARRSAST